MLHEHKMLRLEVKADSLNTTERTFQGYGAVFGNRDSGGDVITKGAFANTLPRIKAGKVKLMDSHDYWGGTRAVLGKVLDAVEDDYGLLCTFYVSATPDGDAVLVKVADGSLDALSIGYETLEQREESDAEGKITRFLDEIKLYEISVCVWGMNALALIDPTSVKTLLGDSPLADAFLALLPAIKAGRRNSAADEEVIRACVQALNSLLEGSDTSGSSEGADGKGLDTPAPTEGDDDAGKAAERLALARRIRASLIQINR